MRMLIVRLLRTGIGAGRALSYEAITSPTGLSEVLLSFPALKRKTTWQRVKNDDFGIPFRFLRRHVMIGADLTVPSMREQKAHAGALSNFAVYSHKPSGLVDEAVDLAQAQSGSLTFILGCEERFEHLR